MNEREILNLVGGAIQDALADGQRVEIYGFGKFYLKTRAARDWKHPSTGEMRRLPESTSVGFKAGGPLKKAVNIQ